MLPHKGPLVFAVSAIPCLLDPSTPSMRKEDDGEKRKEKYHPSGEGGTRSSPATPHRLQCHTACKIKNGRQGAPKWPTGSEKKSTPRFSFSNNIQVITLIFQ